MLPRGVWRKCVTFSGHTTLVQDNKFLGNFLHCRLHARFCACEIGTTQTVHCRCFATHILPNGINLIGWHVELVAAFIREQQIVTLCATYCAAHQTFKFAYAMVVMNNVITRFKILECRTCCARSCSSWRTTPSGEIRFSNESNMCTWHVRPKVHSCCCNINCRWQFKVFQCADGIEQNNVCATLLQALGEALTRHVGIGKNKGAIFFANEFGKTRNNNAGIA